MCSVLAKYPNSEASTIVRTATKLDGVEAWRRLHEKNGGRALGCNVRRESGEASDHAAGREVKKP